MRIVTEQIVEAFLAGKARKIGNTRTDGCAVYLHGNKIAEWRFAPVESGDHAPRELWITTAGWDTNTTKERLRGLPGVMDLGTKRGVLFLNGQKWDGGWTKI